MDSCRLCCESGANVNIFQKGVLYNKIKHCCGNLNILENDGFSQVICTVCERELDFCYHFVLKCEATDKKIRALIVSNIAREVSPKTEVKSEEASLSDDFNDSDEQPIADVKCESFNLDQEQQKTKIRKRRYKERVKLKKEELSCSVCNRKCLNSSTLIVHMRTHTNERPYPCPSCDKTYKDGGTLKRHIERNHMQKRERKFMCEHCGKGFYSKADIQIHMRVHTGETPYSCDICSARFSQISTMLRHKRRHTDAKSQVCSTCGKSFWTKEELKKHFIVHVNVRKFSCPICSVLFKHKSSFQKHMQNHSDPNRYICNHCGKTCNNKGNLKSHMERRHSEKAGHCSVCLKHVSNVEVHMWRHTGQRPLHCDLCPRSFYEMKALAHHVNFKHKKTDRFKCTVEGCGKSFPSNPMLTFHVAKFHEHVTPYSCEKCARGFYRKNDLSRHMVGTHKERLLN